MCGILGQLELKRRIGRSDFERMLDTLTMRGPDDSGIELLHNDRVGLGHRRLSIIDLSPRGRQPMSNEDGSVWLTFNGEIYNFQQLRRTLLGLGHRFRSQTDSEVIVHGYEQWGDDVVHHLRGIFAFALWDQNQRRMLVARDQLGVKPLYYWKTNERLVLASQPRAILEHPCFDIKIDPMGFQQYLAHRYTSYDRSIYTGINKLPSGHVLVAEEGRFHVRQYWKPAYRPIIKDEREGLEAVRTAISEAVRSQLVSDVPVGVFLSGGIDSTAVAGLAVEHAGQGLSSFTVGFDVDAYDEREYARTAAKAFACPQTTREFCLATFLDGLEQFIEIYDEPFFDYSGLFLFSLSQAAREQGIRVILSGDGGDEVFAGYKWYDNLPEPQTNAGTFLQRLVRLAGRKQPTNHTLLRTYFERVGTLRGDEQNHLLGFAPGYSENDLFGRLFHGGLPQVVELQMLDMQTFLPDDILLKVDHASMACGVETRVPLLDLDVVETAFSIDHSLIYKNSERKSLMKSAMAPWIPGELLTTRKKGLGAPISRWMDQGLRKLAQDVLPQGVLVDLGILDTNGIKSVIQGRNSKVEWTLLVAELWARRWLAGENIGGIVRKHRPGDSAAQIKNIAA